MIQNRFTAIFITLVILMGMSLGTILTKVSFEKISPGIFVYLSMGIAMVTMMVYTFVIKKERIPTELMNRKVWFYIIQIGFFNFVTGTLGVYALNFMPATTNTYLTNFIGFITMGMSVQGTPQCFSGIRSCNRLLGFESVLPGTTSGWRIIGDNSHFDFDFWHCLYQ